MVPNETGPLEHAGRNLTCLRSLTAGSNAPLPVMSVFASRGRHKCLLVACYRGAVIQIGAWGGGVDVGMVVPPVVANENTHVVR